MAIYSTGGLTDKSAGQRPEPLECGRADLAHFSLTNPTETKRNRTCEKQNEFGFIVSGRRYFLVVDNWERPFALPTSPFLDNFRLTTRELSQGDSNRNAEWGDFYGWMRRVDPRPPLLRMLPGGSRYKTLALMSSSELFSSSICWISSLRFRSRSSSSDSTSGTLIAVGLFGSRVAGTSGFVIFKMS